MSRGQAPVARSCTACGHVDTDLLTLPIPGFEIPASVCPDPVLCRRRAEARGVWKAA